MKRNKVTKHIFIKIMKRTFSSHESQFIIIIIISVKILCMPWHAILKKKKNEISEK